MNMKHRLQEFYLNNCTKPFKHGEWDCVHVASKWVKFATDKDIILPEYTEDAVKDYNLLKVIDDYLVRTKKPNYGDIVVFKQADGKVTTGIKMEAATLAIEKNGLVPVYFKYLRAWSLPCQQ